MSEYEKLKAQLHALPSRPLSEDEIADWVYGQVVFEHPEVTREYVQLVLVANASPAVPRQG